jgi:hypothetical protein
MELYVIFVGVLILFIILPITYPNEILPALSSVNKHLKAHDSNAIKTSYARFIASFHDPEVQENIRKSKVEQYQGEFLIDLFVNVLGYINNPTFFLCNFDAVTTLFQRSGLTSGRWTFPGGHFQSFSINRILS